jgi:hypothetical protein
MKKILFVLLTVVALLAFASCNMEKRLYRDGWYKEKNTQHAFSTKQQTITEAAITNEIQEVPPLPDSILPAATKTDTAIPFPASIKEKIETLRKTKKELEGDPIIKMSYADARASMAKKGCKPNSTVMAFYYMSLISIICCWFGFGFLMAIIGLIVSVFAINAAAKGDCVEENMAIVKAGRRICWGVIIGTLILALLVLSIVLAILSSPLGQ